MPPGSRTPVTKLPGCRSYRFFSLFSTECVNAPVPQPNHLLAESTMQALLPGGHFPGLLSDTIRGHARVAASSPFRRLLLPLFGSARAKRLREDVRLETKCLSLADGNLRETPHANTDSQLKRRATVSTRRPLRARKALKPSRRWQLKIPSSATKPLRECELLRALA